jgi:CspA family cold shock protein
MYDGTRVDMARFLLLYLGGCAWAADPGRDFDSPANMSARATGSRAVLMKVEACKEMSKKMTGKVKWFNDAKGYGFIELEQGRDVFVHYTVILSEGYRSLKEGQQVEFELTNGPKGEHAAWVKCQANEMCQVA